MGGLSRTIRNFFSAYGLIPGSDKDKRRKIRSAVKSLKSNPFFDPVRRNFSGTFCRDTEELSQILMRMQSLYGSNIQGEPEQQSHFEQLLVDELLKSHQMERADLNFSPLLQKSIKLGHGGVKYADLLFSKAMEVFKTSSVQEYRKHLEQNRYLAELSAFDCDSFLRYFQFRKDRYKQVPAENIYSSLLDFLYISEYLEWDDIIEVDPVMRLAHSHACLEGRYPFGDLEEDLHRLQRLLNTALSPNLIRKVQLILQDGTDEVMRPSMKIRSDFPGEQMESIKAEYKKDRQKHLHDEHSRILKMRVKKLFESRELVIVQVYNHSVSQLFLTNGLGEFRYCDAFKISKSFIRHFFQPQIHPVLKSIILETDFINADLKKPFQDTYDQWISHVERVGKFEEDLTIPSFSKVQPYIGAIQKGTLFSSTEKIKIRDAVKELNKQVDEIIQEDLDLSINLHKTLSLYAMDLETKHPMIIHRMMLNDEKRKELTEGIAISAENLDRYIHLMKMYAVHLTRFKKAVAHSGNSD